MDNRRKLMEDAIKKIGTLVEKNASSVVFTSKSTSVDIEVTEQVKIANKPKRKWTNESPCASDTENSAPPSPALPLVSTNITDVIKNSFASMESKFLDELKAMSKKIDDLNDRVNELTSDNKANEEKIKALSTMITLHSQAPKTKVQTNLRKPDGI